MTNPKSSLVCLALASFVALASAGCPSSEATIDAPNLPESVGADYAVFAQRCSKCHPLSRPLNSGIVDDDYWAMYVARMRRQPGSGISPDDSKQILRFLHYYSYEERQKKERARLQGLAPLTPAPLDGSTGDAP
jgi:hypothetical protein